MHKITKAFKRRKFAAKVHLYFGLLLSLPLLIICITGALLAFQGPFYRLAYPNHYVNHPTTIARSMDDIVCSLDSTREVNRLFLPNNDRETIAVMYADEDNYYFYNSKSGEFQAKMHNLRGIFQEIMILHRTFFIRGAGHEVVGAITFFFWLVILISGIWLFWPKKGRFRSNTFKIRRKAFFYTSHRVLGFFFIIPLFVLGITGNFFTYSDPYIGIYKLFQSEPPKEEKLPEPTPTSDEYNPKNAPSIATVWHWMKEKKETLPAEYSAAFMMRNVESGRPIFLSYENYHDHYGLPKRIRYSIDAQKGFVISERNSQKTSGLQKYTSTIVYLHMGKIGGNGLKLLWFISALMGAWFCISGIRIWILKKPS
ncbi:PepSY domain-containing protein [Halosquirtibacter laminarini]|uniref:PepSY domain-containing protein n=1 Tax=Halosquirtibacter laminarini TaxID=3374600 RepID=A0AC61NBQ2_9BACT|nr:PepSY domain-containing protein [Prolixibacteraceae bacterium]